MHYDASMFSRPTKLGKSRDRVARITVSLDKEDYDEINRIAQAKKVSASWVVRDAVDLYLGEDAPAVTDKNEK